MPEVRLYRGDDPLVLAEAIISVSCSSVIVLPAIALMVTFGSVEATYTVLGGWLLLLLLSSPLWQRLGRIQKGMDGEKRLRETILSSMGDGSLFSPMYIQYGRRRIQIDNVAVTPRGVCVLEAKTISGHISGNDSDAAWTQRKTHGGRSYRTTIRNPVRQLHRQTEALRQVLADASAGDADVVGAIVIIDGHIDEHHGSETLLEMDQVPSFIAGLSGSASVDKISSVLISMLDLKPPKPAPEHP